MKKFFINLKDRIRLFPMQNREKSYFVFYRILGFYPKNLLYYKLAMLHKSTRIVDEKGICQNNERLEYLGDSVLGMVVSNYLYHKYPKENEGFLTVTRSNIVSRNSLNAIGKRLGLDEIIVKAKGVESVDILGNAVEALIGAIYLDAGYDRCSQFISDKILTYRTTEKQLVAEKNYKSLLLEWAIKRSLKVEFLVRDASEAKKNEHSFYTTIKINGHKVSEANGRSKIESQQNAAKYVMKTIKKDMNFTKMVRCPIEE